MPLNVDALAACRQAGERPRAAGQQRGRQVSGQAGVGGGQGQYSHSARPQSLTARVHRAPGQAMASRAVLVPVGRPGRCPTGRPSPGAAVPPVFRGRGRTGHCSPQVILSVMKAAAEDGQVGEQGSRLLRVRRAPLARGQAVPFDVDAVPGRGQRVAGRRPGGGACRVPGAGRSRWPPPPCCARCSSRRCRRRPRRIPRRRGRRAGRSP